MAVDWIKDPDATLDWVFDWATWLRSGETIATSTWTVSAGIVLESSGIYAPTNTVSTATAWLSGGSPGEPYILSNKVTTNQGRIDERSITIRVTNR